MTRRIIYLAIPVAIFTGIGLIAVHDFFSSFPPSKTVIAKLVPSENTPAASDLTESFFDDSGSMKGYFGEQYINVLRIVKSHIRERGNYRYYAFSDTETSIAGDVWEVVEDARFYHQNNTYFDTVLDSIVRKVRSGKQISKNFLIVTDGIQDVSKIQDYSRIVNKVSDLLDAELFFQLIAIKLPFDGRKYPEGGSFVSYRGESPLFCFIFTYQHDFGWDLYNKLSALNLPVKFLGFGTRNIHASIMQFSTPAINRDGSKNTFQRFKDETPVTYLISRSETGGTLRTNIALSVKGVNVDRRGFQHKTPEFCGHCLPMSDRGDVEHVFLKSVPHVTVSATGAEPLSDAGDNLEIEYSLFFRNWDKGSKTIACDLTLCNWLPVHPPAWLDAWSSDCDHRRECFEGKTPFLTHIIIPILNKSVREYTLGYAVIRNR